MAKQLKDIAEKLQPRHEPYLWVTWLSGLLAGDKHCKWAAWFKAHYRNHQEIADPNENALSVWKAEHTDMVTAMEEDLRKTWPTVRLEDQNKFNIQGHNATVGGCADLVTIAPHARPVVYDCKTGRKRDSDYWQVLEYMTFLPMADPTLAGIKGVVAYRDGSVREVPALTPGDPRRTRIIDLVTELGGGPEPARVPSEHECRFCRIACCPDRAQPTAGGFQRAITVDEF